MYKAFLASKNKQIQKENATKKDIPGIDPEVKEKVDAVWKEIEPQCISVTSGEERVGPNGKLEDESSLLSDWKIVRLFVSSTFADFFNEREVLVKKVFPELREWCRDRNLKLIECDLRWGVPRDTPSGKTVSICLEEIDKCIDVSNGHPLFLGLLGERYGWIPSESDISPEVNKKYQWVDGTSITCMEILHGAYRNRNPNAAFFVRNSSVYSDIPDSHIDYFVDKNPLSSHHLKILKENLIKALPDRIYHYEPTFKQMTNVGEGKQLRVELEGFDDFAKNALEFFKSAILRIHPEKEVKEINLVHPEQGIQWLYLLDKANGMIGRLAEKEILIKYLTEGVQDHFERTDSSRSQLRKLEEWDVSDSDSPLCVVEAPSGWGKTTLVSSVVRDVVRKQTDWKVFYHLVGSTPSSVQIEKLLQRILAAMITEPTDKEKAVMEVEKIEDQITLLKTALSQFRHRKEKLIIVIDNLNALSNSDTLHHLSWLPIFVPPNIRFLVSTNQHLPTTSRLFEHPTLKLSLCAMAQDQLADIATHYLGTFSKKLHHSQLTALLTKTKVDNPLWLSLMVEELRIFGSFDLMDKRIGEMPQSLDEFLVQVFERLVHEDQTQNLVKKVLCLIACSRYGIPSDQVLQILGESKTKEPIALLEWLQVKRSLKPYLRMSGFLEEMITFSHDAVQKAVRDHFLSEKADVCYWNTVLADFYQFGGNMTRANVLSLLYHMRQARLYPRMVKFMRSDKQCAFFVPAFQRSDYLKDCRCRGLADAVIPATAPIMLCHFCSNKSYGFNRSIAWHNKNCCAICGEVCNNRPLPARACMRHAERRGPDMVKCFLCNSVVNLGKKNTSNLTPNPALLCHFCSFGNSGNTCAVLSCDRF